MEKYSREKIIDGLSVAREIKDSVAKDVDLIRGNAKQNRAPSICFIRVGDDPASKIYVDAKKKACDDVGIVSKQIHIESHEASFDKVASVIELLNNDDEIDSILLQLPLPEHLKDNTDELLSRIAPEKDVDGLSPINVGRLWNSDSCDGFIPCTPRGILTLLKKYNVEIKGANVVIIGRSRLVGKPMAALMLREDATVTIVHSRSKNIKDICGKADILICAAGKPELVNESWIKAGAVVIDVGINRIEGKDCCEIVGDVAFASVINKIKLITPVPGGVGPMTIASLLENVVSAYKHKNNISK